MMIDDPTVHETFGARLKRLMGARGITQTQLAERTGIDRSVLNRLANGKAQPRAEHVAWLAPVLELTPEELMRDLDLAPESRRALDWAKESLERLMRAEGARDEAIANLEGITRELERERAGRLQDHQEHARAMIEVRAQTERQLREQQDAAARQDAQAQAEKATWIAHLGQSEAALRQAAMTEDWLRSQIVQLQHDLAAEKGKKVTSAFLAGMAGLLIGGASNRENDGDYDS